MLLVLGGGSDRAWCFQTLCEQTASVPTGIAIGFGPMFRVGDTVPDGECVEVGMGVRLRITGSGATAQRLLPRSRFHVGIILSYQFLSIHEPFLRFYVIMY